MARSSKYRCASLAYYPECFDRSHQQRGWYGKSSFIITKVSSLLLLLFQYPDVNLNRKIYHWSNYFQYFLHRYFWSFWMNKYSKFQKIYYHHHYETQEKYGLHLHNNQLSVIISSCKISGFWLFLCAYLFRHYLL